VKRTENFIEINKLSKSYANGESDLQVLRNVSLDVKDGEFLAICGRSGIGKSTLLRMVAGLIAPSSGSIRLGGQLVTEPPDSMGFVTQDYSRSLLPWFSVEKNVALPLKRSKTAKMDKKARVDSVLAAVGLSDFAKFYPWQLSGGMQQRVAIARALVLDPKLLLLDEPFASVDAQIRLELEDLIADLVRQKQITTIIVTHDIDEAIYLSDRVILLSDHPASIGKIFPINLKRPRSQIETRSDPKFIKIRTQLYSALRDK
jgi:NitT/TauT family transport system ATP-binding protein